ncbi:MAG TPA: O-antigen ligase family protein [Bacteroidales bacterium]
MTKIGLFKISRETAFILVLVCSSLFYTRMTLDYTLVPRFVFLSFCLFLFVGLNVKVNSFKLEVDILLISYLGYVLFTCGSLLWTCNTSETLFESSKLLLGFGVFVSAALLSIRREFSFRNIGIASLILFLIALLVAVSQIIEMDHFTRDSLYHITGVSSHKNLFSAFLFLNLVFCLAFLFHTSKNLRIVTIVCILISLGLVFLLQSRAVWLGLVSGIFMFVVLYAFKHPLHYIFKKIPIYLLIIGVVLLIAGFVLFVFPIVIEKIIELMPNPNPKANLLDTTSGFERLTIWEKTILMIKGHPAFGVGAGNWQIFFPNSTLSGLWRVEDLNVTFQRPHNDFLWILSETGIAGFTLYLIFSVGLFLHAIKTFLTIDDQRQRMIHGLFISGMTGFMVLSFFDFPKERIEHTIWINVIYAILYCKIRENSIIRPLFIIRWRWWASGFTLLLLIFIIMIGFLRFRGEFNTKRIYTYREKQDWQKVKSACDNAFSFAYTIDPVSIPIHWYRGNANASVGNYGESLNDLLVAYRKHPYNRNVLNDLGSAYVMTGNTELAKTFYREAARISPRFDDPRLNLIALYINEGNWEEAAFWEKSITHDSERRSYYQKLIQEAK